MHFANAFNLNALSKRFEQSASTNRGNLNSSINSSELGQFVNSVGQLTNRRIEWFNEFVNGVTFDSPTHQFNSRIDLSINRLTNQFVNQ